MMRMRRTVARRSLAGATVAAGAMAIVAVLVAPALSASTAASSGAFGINSGAANAFKAAGPGYTPPGGIYAPFTDCPLLNPLMAESVGGDGTGCVAGDATGGTLTIGPTVVQVVHPVTAQFGLWDPQGASPSQFTGGILPPPDGRELVASPEYVPGGLTKALGCPSTAPVIKKLCDEVHANPADNTVTALVEEAGPITNFAVTTWTQPVMFRLINPLLGDNCTIGSVDNPVVLNPQVTGTLGFLPDPNGFPQTAVLEVTGGQATDNVFSVPPVQGCGPGGAANIAVDLALDASQGLPSPSGSNSLTLVGSFYIADCYQPSHQAHNLLLAFRASHS
jgi:hypothetical protein